MTQMIERVARAFATQEAIRILGCSIPRHIDLVWPQRMNEARAAIEAMRHFTPEMREAFWSTPPDDSSFTACYESLIDAALKEGS